MSTRKSIGKVNKIIGIDIDNTIAATDKQIRSLIEKNYHIKSKRNDIFSWFYSVSLAITPDEEKIIFDDFHKNHLLTLSILPRARDSLIKLSEHYTIWLLTNRPTFTRIKTIEWLEKKSIPYNKIFFLEQKSTLSSNINYLIDDKAETALEFAMKGIKVYLMNYPWNKYVSHPLIYRVQNWKSILEYLN